VYRLDRIVQQNEEGVESAQSEKGEDRGLVQCRRTEEQTNEERDCGSEGCVSE